MPSSDGTPVGAGWAAAGLAPQLHRVVRLPGGWLQVEMEWLGAEHGWQELASIKEPAAAAAARAVAPVRLVYWKRLVKPLGGRWHLGSISASGGMVRG